MVSQTISRDVKLGIDLMTLSSDSIFLKLHVDDAKILLGDLLDYKEVDSLLNVYQMKDSINLEIINKSKIIILNREKQIENYKIEIFNYNKIIENKDKQFNILSVEIKDQDKKIKKLKRQKRFAIISGITGVVSSILITAILVK